MHASHPPTNVQSDDVCKSLPGAAYGGFFVRVFTGGIDGLFIIILTALAVAVLLAFLPSSRTWPSFAKNLAVPLLYLLLLVVSLTYVTLFQTISGGTPGKLLAGYRIVGADGRHVDRKRSLTRAVAYAVSGLLLGLGFFWIALDGQKQGWHDKVARTYVVRKDFVRQQ